MTEPTEESDRHASWLELFFDLVVVVAVSQLAHLLHGDPDGLAITTFFALYLATWLVWTTFTLYSNVLADNVRIRSMFLGMSGIATMAASVPHGMTGRANVFAGAYLITSAIGAASFTRSGRVPLSWSAATRNAGLTPWVVSFWVPDPWWKLALWLAGLAVTLWFSVLSDRRHGDRFLAELNDRLARQAARRRESPTVLVAARVDAAHLGERLGLFVIIVLGEAMLQLIVAWSAADDWTRSSWHFRLLELAVTAGFLLLIALWALNVRYAFAEAHPYPPHVVLPLHFVVVAATTTIAAGLGAVAAAPDQHLAPAMRWLLCTGVATFLLVVTVLARAKRRWPLSAVAIALPVVVCPFSALVPAAVVAVVLAVAAGGLRANLRRAVASPA